MSLLLQLGLQKIYGYLLAFKFGLNFNYIFKIVSLDISFTSVES